MSQDTIQKIIIDTDPGIDDAMAIHQAFADPRLHVLGLTTIFGNVSTPMATRNALRLVEMAAYPAAVAHGAERPLVREGAPPADFVHGAEGFGTVPPAEPKGKADDRSAAVFLAEMAAAHPGEIIICAVGPLTNLALALTHDPDIVRNVHSVVVMGGSVARHGNVSDCAEANIWGDPDAADAVFAADWNVTMVGLDVTEKTRCEPEDFARLAKNSPEIGGFLNEAVDFYFDFHVPKTKYRCCFMHDPSAIMAITDPAFFGFEELPLEVVTSGDEMGRTKRYAGTDRRLVKAAMTVDSDAARDRFLTVLDSADEMAEARRGGNMNVEMVDYQSPDAAASMRRSLHETGFAVLYNHPISPERIEQIYQGWGAFFAGDEKFDYAVQPPRHDGYFAFRSENAKDSAVKDLKEFYHVYPESPLPDALNGETTSIYNDLLNLGQEVLSWIQHETPSDVAESFSMPLDEMMTDSQQSLLRILHYPPVSEVDAEPDAVRAAAHEDINLITLLLSGSKPGLQAMDSEGNWHDVSCDAGMITINNGDMLAMASGNYYPSTTHRVVNPDAGQNVSRYSMPMFLHPRPDVFLQPGTTADDYLQQRLREIGLKS